MANATEAPLQRQLAAMHLTLVEKGCLQAVWITPTSVCFGLTTWNMLLAFLYVRSKDTLCHCSKACDTLWYQVSSGIIGLACPYVSSDSTHMAKELSYPTNIPLNTSKEQAATSSVNWSNLSVGTCNTGDGFSNSTAPRLRLAPYPPIATIILRLADLHHASCWPCWPVMHKLLFRVSDELGNCTSHLPGDFPEPGLFLQQYGIPVV